MALKLNIKKIDIEAGGKPEVLLNKEDAEELGVHSMDRVNVILHDSISTAIVDVTEHVIKPGEIGLFREMDKTLGVQCDHPLLVEPATLPESVSFIKQRLYGNSITPEQIYSIVHDFVDNKLSDVEAAYFLASAYVKEFSDEETVALAEVMVETGQTLKFSRGPVVDKHSIGGIPGNRTTMVIVPIVAASGLLIPKTSSRAISSPSGTSDTMEVLAPVNLSLAELTRIVNKTGGCIAWGGSVNLVPADDMLSKLRYTLRLDPHAFVLASILGKKKAAGAEKIVIDIPTGIGAKVENVSQARELAHSFISLGSKLGMDVQCVITPGEKPIGNGVGPALEARDVLRVLENDCGNEDLKNKSLSLAGMVLEMGGKARRGEGYALAESILSSGKALEKMKEIIAEQGGNPAITHKDISVGSNTYDVCARGNGTVYGFDNIAITRIARAAGAPKNKGSGIYIHVRRGQFVKEDEPLYTIYADHDSKLESAVKLSQTLDAIIMEKAILGIVENVKEEQCAEPK